MRNIYITVVLIAIAVVLLPGLLISFVKYVPDTQQPGLFSTVKIFGNNVLEQKLKVNNNNFPVWE